MTDLPIDQYEERFQILDKSGQLDESVLNVDLDDEFLIDLYRRMKLARMFDERAINLQRQGRLGTYAPVKGQEGCQVGAVLALDDSDPLFPTYRETPALLTRGVALTNILLYWGGDERGSKIDREKAVYPLSIPVGSHALHAVGASRARQVRGEDPFTVAFFGDGATSEGDLLSAMNFAGVWETPVLFFCQNNQWAISVNREKQTASETLAQKADAFGFPGLRVDGNDPIACYQAIQSIREYSIDNSTPIFVEAETYRLGDHTTSDDASRYRSDEEVKNWLERDPLKRVRLLLESRQALDKTKQEEIEENIEGRIKKAIEDYENFDDPDPKDMFQYTYEQMPSELTEQFEQLREELDDG